MKFRRRLTLLSILALCGMAAIGLSAAQPQPGESGYAEGPEWVSPPVTPSSWDGDIRDLPAVKPWQPGDPMIEIPRRFYADPAQALAHAPLWLDVECDPLVRKQAEYDAERDRALAQPHAITTPLINVAGQGYTNLSPPDVAGDVGPNHYIQAINGASGSSVQVYSKTGAKIGNAFSMVGLGGTGSCTSTYGDPIVLYDRLADRWFLLEFTNGGTGLCMHVSKTADPTSGGWWSYTFDQATFPDYPHCAVWWNGYYCTANEGNPPIYVFDRAKMLTGAAATQQTFRATKLAGYGFQALTPVDFVGATAAPANAPFIAIRHNDDEAHLGAGANGTRDYIDMYSLQVNWTTPASSVFTTLPQVNIAEFNSWFLDYSTFATVPQPGSTKKLDPIREVILNRANYMNYTTYESIVGDFATNIDPARTGNVVDSGVRWFELRRTPPGSGSWTLYQEGTFGDGGNTKHHFEGSIIQDKAGNIGLGFCLTQTSPSNVYASIKYTGRYSNDTTGVMTQGETDVILGAGSETSGRWGDYGTMALDPSDDCTYWFSHEYRPASSWATQIATFKILPATAAAPTFTSVGQTSLTVNWSAVGGAHTYDVYRAAGSACSGASKINASPVTGLSYNDTGLTCASPYSYYIVGVSPCGTSANGSCGTVTTTSCATCTAPGVPTLSVPSASCSGVNLSWAAGTGTTLSYNVYRSTNTSCPAGALTKIAGPVASTSYSDTSAVAGTTYTYVVRGACDAGGTNESADSNCQAGTRAAVPAAPTAVTATGSCTGVSVSWTGNAQATSYNVLRGSACGTVLATFTGVTSPYSDTTAVAGTTYNYWVVAINACGTSVNSSCATGTRSLPTPSAPAGVTATPGCTGNSISWSSSTGATSYNVLRGSVCGTVVSTFTNVASPYNDTTAVAGTAYNYWVVAINACGTSVNSSCATATRPDPTPAAPTAVAATGSCTGVSVSWTGNAQATSYNVLRGSVCGTTVTTFGGVTSPYSDTTAVAGTTYNYWVVAVNGCGTSPNSSCATGARMATPAAPTAVAATSGCTGISVSWTGNAQATSYNVLRGSVCGTVVTTFTGATSPYNDTTAVVGTAYNYWVVAVNTCGTSANSSCASVTRTTCAPNIIYTANGPWSQVAGMGNGDAVVDPGESWDVAITLTNNGTALASNVVASLTAAGATFCTGTSGFGTIGIGGTSTATFRFSVDKAFTCGNSLSFDVINKASNEGTYSNQNGAFTEVAGTAGGGTPVNYPQTSGLPLSIPDNNTTGVNSTITITDTGTITDLNVRLGVTHTWVGDLVFTLTHVDTGTSVTIIDRPGYTGSGNGCSRDNIAATLDDAAGSPVENQCSTTPPAINGTFSPNNPLSAFNGQSLAGTWRLNSSDRASSDTGSVTSWSLDITTAGSTCNVWNGSSCAAVALKVPYSVTPTRIVKNDANATDVTVTWDATNCSSSDYHLVWGYGGDVATLAGNSPTVSGGKCHMGTTGTLANWNSGVPDPTSDPGAGKFIWLLVVGDDNGTTEGSWGLNSGAAERGGTAASGQCSCTTKSTSGVCGTN